MHATSPDREAAARLLAVIMRESGADGAAYGWTDDLAPGWVVPVCSVGPAPRERWGLDAPGTFAVLVEERDGLAWHLVLRGADDAGLERASTQIAHATHWLRGRVSQGRPQIPDGAIVGPLGRFVALLDAYRLVGFETGAASHERLLRGELERSVDGCPAPLSGPARAVARAFGDPARLGPALLGLGSILEAERMLASAVAMYVITYELTLLQSEARVAIDAARFAGRAFRKMTQWEPAVRWYGLGRRLAEHEDDPVSLARVLDGLGNTYRDRGAYPKARDCYQKAWSAAQSAGDPVEIGNVALGLMNAERKAGRLEAAAEFGWKALCVQRDSRERAHLLLNVGTLLLEGGDLDAAERAYRLAQASDSDRELVLMARDALAYCAALRGDSTAYESLRPRAVQATPYLRVQIGYFRGLALQTLGDLRAARVLQAVCRYARAHGLAEWQVKATQRLERTLPPSVRAIDTPAEVRQGLQELCASLS